MDLAWRIRLIATGNTDDDDSGITIDTEIAIITAAKSDPRAFAPLYQHYAPLILRYCDRRLGNRELANDATAQTFTKAIAALHSYDPKRTRPGATFRSWLFTIAHNVVIDQHRRQRHHLSLDHEPTALWLNGTPHLTDPAPGPEEQLLSRDTAEHVRSILNKLPERQRQIVELRLAGLSGTEIATSMNITLSAMKSAQARAYATLRDLLQHDRPHPETGK